MLLTQTGFHECAPDSAASGSTESENPVNTVSCEIPSSLPLESNCQYLVIKDMIECKVSASYPSLKIHIGDRELNLVGKLEDMPSAREMIKTELKSVKTFNVQKPLSAVKTLKKWNKKDITRKIFNREVEGCVIVDTSRGIHLYAPSSLPLDQAALDQAFLEAAIDVTEEQREVTKSVQWKELLKDTEFKYRLSVIDAQPVSLMGFKEDVEAALKILKNHLERRAETLESFNLEDCVLVENHETIANNFQLGTITAVVEIPSSNDTMVNLMGSKEDVDNTKLVLEKVKRVPHKQLPIIKPGAEHFFKNTGKSLCDGVTVAQKCLIFFAEEHQVPRDTNIQNVPKSTAKVSNEEAAKGPVQRDACVKTKRQSDTGAPKCPPPLQLILSYGNMEDQKANVFVVPLNVAKQHLATLNVTKALAVKGGPTLANIFGRRLNECGSLSTGSVLEVHVAGQNCLLDCDAVIFIACTIWDGHNGHSDKALRKGISDTLERCKNQNVCTMAMPAIGPGLAFNFPKNEAARIFGEELNSFVTKEPNTSIRKINIVIPQVSQDVFNAYKDTLMKVKWHNQISFCNENGDPFRSPTHGNEIKVEIGSLSICTGFGNIVNESTDAIVNSTNFNQWSNQSVACAIFTAAGPEVVQEARSKANNQPALTKAGSLRNCKSIFHFDCQKDLRHIEDIIKKIIVQCAEKGLKSVAIPAIGTGECGLDPQKVAKSIINAIASVAQTQGLASLSCVRLITFQQHIYKIFSKTLQEWIKPLNQPSWNHIDALSKRLRNKPIQPNEALTDLDILEHPVSCLFELHVIGLHSEDVDTALKLLEVEFENQYMEKEIKDTLIDAFSLEEIQSLFSLIEGKPGVQMTLHRVNKCIILKGCAEDVSEESVKVLDKLREIVHARLEQACKERASLLIQWGYQEGNVMIPFEENASQLLEDRFIAKDKGIVKVELANGKKAAVNMTTMKAIQDGMEQEMTVLRLDLEREHQLPAHWDNMRGKLLMLVKLDPNSPEYQNVHSSFTSTATNVKVLQIERIQNKYLYITYDLRKNYITMKNGATEVHERTLYHGTQSENRESINYHGFNRSFAGRHASVYGNGVYFAVKASYSTRNTYSSPDPQTNKRYMYQVKVLTGRYTTGHPGLNVPPSASGNSPYDQYDSIVDKEDNPNMFIAFHDNQAYPEYLITFE
uniref:Poly [ADP-ribose] polymerase n=1 Tax=Leptobrachium leishanense TaxID=445787 RepID=A0A8C5QKD4_9ANUR